MGVLIWLLLPWMRCSSSSIILIDSIWNGTCACVLRVVPGSAQPSFPMMGTPGSSLVLGFGKGPQCTGCCGIVQAQSIAEESHWRMSVKHSSIHVVVVGDQRERERWGVIPHLSRKLVARTFLSSFSPSRDVATCCPRIYSVVVWSSRCAHRSGHCWP